MSLDVNNTDRSYLFGRLLALAEKIEKSTYSGAEMGRETNAIRLQSAFVQHPMHIWAIIEGQLNPYYAKLEAGLREYYKNIVTEIMVKVEEEDYSSLNKGLDDIYLMGYYLQRKELNTKKTKNKDEENK